MSEQRAASDKDSKLTAALEENAHLRTALGSSREIGAAVGILMERHTLTPGDAWEMLRSASQARNVPVRLLAADLVLSGELDLSAGPGMSRGDG